MDEDRQGPGGLAHSQRFRRRRLLRCQTGGRAQGELAHRTRSRPARVRSGPCPGRRQEPVQVPRAPRPRPGQRSGRSADSGALCAASGSRRRPGPWRCGGRGRASVGCTAVRCASRADAAAARRKSGKGQAARGRGTSAVASRRSRTGFGAQRRSSSRRVRSSCSRSGRRRLPPVEQGRRAAPRRLRWLGRTGPTGLPLVLRKFTLRGPVGRLGRLAGTSSRGSQGRNLEG